MSFLKGVAGFDKRVEAMFRAESVWISHAGLIEPVEEDGIIFVEAAEIFG